MSIKDTGALKIDNDLLYDNATSLTQKVSSPNQQGITNDQIDSFVNKTDRRFVINTFPDPQTIILDFGSLEQFFIDLTADPGTLSFSISNILNLVTGQRGKIQINKNANQSIVFLSATGPDIVLSNNRLEIVAIGLIPELVYDYLDGRVSGSQNIPAGNLAESNGSTLVDSGVAASDLDFDLANVILRIGSFSIPTWTYDSIINVPNTSGKVPIFIIVTAIAVVANNGYSIGDIISLPMGANDFEHGAEPNDWGFLATWTGSSSISLIIGPSPMFLLVKTNENLSAISNINWDLRVEFFGLAT